jgi:predicted membrane protein
LRLSIFGIELAAIWSIYFAFGFVTTHEMPLWLTTFLVIVVDRTTSFITNLATNRRASLTD